MLFFLMTQNSVADVIDTPKSREPPALLSQLLFQYDGEVAFDESAVIEKEHDKLSFFVFIIVPEHMGCRKDKGFFFCRKHCV